MIELEFTDNERSLLLVALRRRRDATMQQANEVESAELLSLFDVMDLCVSVEDKVASAPTVLDAAEYDHLLVSLASLEDRVREQLATASRDRVLLFTRLLETTERLSRRLASGDGLM